MFSRSFQPSIVSLFSSTGSDPFTGLWAVEKDDALPEDSFIHFLNDETSLPATSRDQNLVSDNDADSSRQMTRLDQTVLYLQSPTLSTTFIRCPSVGSDIHLKHPWLHIQVKQLGREWSFEVVVLVPLLVTRTAYLISVGWLARVGHNSGWAITNVDLTA